MFAYVSEAENIQKTRDDHQYHICCSKARDFLSIIKVNDGCLENEDLRLTNGKRRPLENEDLQNEGPLENEDPLENKDLENKDP